MSKLMNFGKAIINHSVDGLAKLDIDTVNNRLAKCNKCELRVKDVCTHPSCGCFLDTKVWFASEDCPIGLWDKIE